MKSLLLSLALTFIAGVFYAFCYPSFLGNGWLPLLFIALPFFLWRLEVAATIKSSILHILAYNLGLNILGYYWIPATLREFGQLPTVISFVLGLLFTFILQPHWWFYLFWKKYRPNFSWYSEKGVLATALVMTVLEQFVPQQFPSYVGSPWLHLAPYLSLAPIMGVVVFSFITFWLSLEIYTQIAIRKFRPFVWIVFFIFVLSNALTPLKVGSSDKNLPIRIVQANIGNFLKIQSEKGDENSFESVNKKYLDLSLTKNGFTPDLIIWPETAYPNTFYGKDTLLEPIFSKISTDLNSEILIGGYDQNKNKSPFDFIESVYNSAILIDKSGVKETYHKNILIPFGETLPFGPLNSHVVSVFPAVSLFARGQGTPLIETIDHFRFVTPICYEILESNYMRFLLNSWGKNHFVINLTNDSWYGDTAEPFQHLFLSKWRALEFNLPIIRSTNTGISSVIFPDGSESRRLGVGETGILDIKIPIGDGEETIYQLFGMIPTFVLVVLLFGTIWIKEKSLTLKKK